MSKMRFLAVVLLTMSVAACGLLPATPTPAPASPIPEPATETPTPFQPVFPTDTPTPTETPTITPTPVDPWENFPGPDRDSATAIPRPIRTVVGADSRINIIVLGTDDASGRTSMNSDVMVLVSIDTESWTVSLISFPRDLYVYVPGRNMTRINTAFAYGGRDLVAQTLLYNFGIEVDYYARVNFASFVRAVDTLGGIDVEVANYLSDECGGTWYTYQAGRTYHMNGQTALCYVRMRKNSGGDFGRHIRAQEVLLAIFAKTVSLEGLTRIPELYGQYSQTVDSDLDLTDIVPLVPIAAQVAQEPTVRIRRFTLAGMIEAWTTPGGGYVLLPDKEAIQAMLEIALN